MKKIYGYISGIFLAGLLLLLTVGLPVTYNAVKELKNNIAQNKVGDNPYSNATEEKTPSNNLTINEEYMHDHNHGLPIPTEQISIAYIHAHEAVYTAYHGELHCPPPNILS